MFLQRLLVKMIGKNDRLQNSYLSAFFVRKFEKGTIKKLNISETHTFKLSFGLVKFQF